MTDVDRAGRVLHVTFTRREHVCGMVRDLAIPVESVRSAAVLTDWSAARGVGLGLTIPGVLLLGTWWSPGRVQLVAVQRGRPALHLVLHGQRVHEVLVSTLRARELLDGLPTRPGRLHLV